MRCVTCCATKRKNVNLLSRPVMIGKSMRTIIIVERKLIGPTRIDRNGNDKTCAKKIHWHPLNMGDADYHWVREILSDRRARNLKIKSWNECGWRLKHAKLRVQIESRQQKIVNNYLGWKPISAIRCFLNHTTKERDDYSILVINFIIYYTTIETVFANISELNHKNWMRYYY